MNIHEYFQYFQSADGTQLWGGITVTASRDHFSLSERRRGTVSRMRPTCLHPNSQYMSPAAAKQASAVCWTVFKPMAIHRTVLHTYEPPLWHMGPTAPQIGGGLCGAGTESEPPRQVRAKAATMRSHEACWFSKMRNNVPYALVAIE